VAAAVLPLPGAALLSLSADGAVLAACSGNAVHCYSTQQLTAGSTAALAQLGFPAEVVQLAWQPGSSQYTYAALLDDGTVHLGSLAGSSSSGGPAPLAAARSTHVNCLAWSLDGQRLAVGAEDQVLIYAPGSSGGADSWRQVAAVQVLSADVQDDEQQLQVDSLCWVSPSAMLVSSKLVAGGGEEEPFAPLCMLTWAPGQADPSADNLELSGEPHRHVPDCMPLGLKAAKLGFALRCGALWASIQDCNTARTGAAGVPCTGAAAHPACLCDVHAVHRQAGSAYPPLAPAPPRLAEFFASNIMEHAADQGPWLRTATVPHVRHQAGAAATAAYACHCRCLSLSLLLPTGAATFAAAKCCCCWYCRRCCQASALRKGERALLHASLVCWRPLMQTLIQSSTRIHNVWNYQ